MSRSYVTLSMSRSYVTLSVSRSYVTRLFEVDTDFKNVFTLKRLRWTQFVPLSHLPLKMCCCKRRPLWITSHCFVTYSCFTCLYIVPSCVTFTWCNDRTYGSTVYIYVCVSRKRITGGRKGWRSLSAMALCMQPCILKFEKDSEFLYFNAYRH